jgi:hypothetical protein
MSVPNLLATILASAVESAVARVLAGAVLAFFASAGTSAEPARGGLFSVNLPVIAILHGELFVGEAVGYLDRTGIIEVMSVQDARNKCMGTFRYTGSTTGLADMRCGDGSQASLSFNALSAFSGYGYGDTPRGPASFTFGLDPDEAAPHLTVPRDKKLVLGTDGLRLESIRP